MPPGSSRTGRHLRCADYNVGENGDEEGDCSHVVNGLGETEFRIFVLVVVRRVFCLSRLHLRPGFGGARVVSDFLFLLGDPSHGVVDEKIRGGSRPRLALGEDDRLRLAPLVQELAQ